MIDDFDVELGRRLEGLAAAVPVDDSAPLSVVRPQMQTGRTGRRAVLARIVPVLSILVIGVLAAGAAGIGPFGPGKTPASTASASTGQEPSATPEPTGPLTSTSRDGDFELTLRAGKARYLPMEPIDVTASLSYSGPQPQVEITHDSGGPVMFGIREKVFGEIRVGGVSLLMCGGSTLLRAAPLNEPFRKSGGFSGDHPDAASFKAWLLDPVLELPAGTWHITASASSPCMSAGPTFSVQTELVILVEDPFATPGPSPTPYDYGVTNGADIGDFTLELHSKKSTYAVGEAIQVSASYTPADVEDETTIQVAHVAPEMGFWIAQLDAPNPDVVWTKVYDSACVELALPRGQPRVVPLSNSTLLEMRAQALPADFETLLEQGILRLPQGRWRITASVQTSLGSCADPKRPQRSLVTSVEFTVGAPPSP